MASGRILAHHFMRTAPTPSRYATLCLDRRHRSRRGARRPSTAYFWEALVRALGERGRERGYRQPPPGAELACVGLAGEPRSHAAAHHTEDTRHPPEPRLP